MRTNAVPEGHDVEPLRLARFLDGQSFFRPPEISVLLRALQRNRWGIGKGLGWNGVQSYSVSRLFEVDDFGYQITPITSPNYKTIWISSKHRVAFFNRFFWVIGNIGTVHSFLYIFVAIPSSDPKIGLAHIGDFAKNHPNQKATRSQTTKIPLSFRNLKESNNQNKAAHLFVACFPKEKLTAW